MNIPYFGWLPHWFTNLLDKSLWIAVGAFLKWLFDLRKTSAETKRAKAETAALHRREEVKEAADSLVRAAAEIRKKYNNATLPADQWASHLKKPELIYEALREAEAILQPGTGDRWEILSSRVSVARDRR